MAKDILNIRFRLENVRPFPSGTYVKWDDSERRRFTRYQLYDYVGINSTNEQKLLAGRTGSSSLPTIRPYSRMGTPPVEYAPEHARMQGQLMKELASEYPNASIIREEDFVDVAVRTPHELILFEIKSDLEPRTVIRQSLGQILEYAFYPNRQETLPVKLVIVGRGQLSDADRNYISRLKQEFHLPIEFRVVNPSQFTNR